MTKKSKKTIRTRVLLQRILNAIKNSFPESANKDKIALLCVFFKGICKKNQQANYQILPETG